MQGISEPTTSIKILILNMFKETLVRQKEGYFTAVGV